MTDNTYSASYPSKKFNGANSAAKAAEFFGAKAPPHSNESEIATLGSMMLDRAAISKAQEIISSESFYSEANKVIFDTAVAISDKGAVPDIAALVQELIKKNLLDFVGGTFYLTEINAKTPTAANVEFHAHIVQEKYLKRMLIDTSGSIMTACYDDSTDALEEIDNAEGQIFAIAEKRIKKSFETLKELGKKALKVIEAQKDSDVGAITGVPTGYIDLDEKLSGFQKSDLIIIAGRPSMGKTALALSIARNAAKEFHRTVAFFSIEMSSIQLVIRLISAETKINQQKIRNGQINQRELDSIVEKLGQLTEAPLLIDDSPNMSMVELRAKCRRMKAEHNVDMIIIDYLQLMNPPKAENREREISIISRSLKQLAKELDVPVIALAQLNRSVESRADKKPLLSDLRESGSIEQDADVVLFVNRPEQYGIMTYEDQSPTENTAEIIVGKQRNGPTGIIRLAYLKDYARFENLALVDYDEPQFAKREIEDGPGF